jgi:hypothetical protein
MPANPRTHLSDQEHDALSKRGLALHESRPKAIQEPAENDQYVAIPIAAMPCGRWKF